MANIKKDIDIANVTVDKKRYRFTGLSFNSSTDEIHIVYNIIALNASNVELFTYEENRVIKIASERFGETLIADFLTAGQAMIISELPSV
jgi:hypothetical protein